MVLARLRILSLKVRITVFLMILVLMQMKHGCMGIGFIRQIMNSIVYEVIRTISILLVFFYEKILGVNKAPKRKQTIFTLLEVFVRAKNCCLYCLVFACFCFVSSFLLVTCFCALKIFSQKRNKQT